jgi:hypothetical protein
MRSSERRRKSRCCAEYQVREAAICDAFQRLISSVSSTSAPEVVLEVLERECVRLFSVDAVEFYLPAAQTGPASPDSEAGPTLEAFATGQRVSVDDLDSDVTRWPGFVRRATGLGYKAVSVVPMSLREEKVGSVALLRRKTGALSSSDADIGEVLANVAASCLDLLRDLRHHVTLSAQLQRALSSRVIIEQAKGILAERGGVSLSAAFEQMRTLSRGTNRKLADIAHDVVAGTLPPRGRRRTRER